MKTLTKCVGDTLRCSHSNAEYVAQKVNQYARMHSVDVTVTSVIAFAGSEVSYVANGSPRDLERFMATLSAFANRNEISNGYLTAPTYRPANYGVSRTR